MRLIVSVFDGENFPVGSQVCEPGQPLMFQVESRYLIAAGQKYTVGISVFDADLIALLQSGPKADARHITQMAGGDDVQPMMEVPVVWDVSFIPSTRLLADILADVVTHGLNNPEHGVNCSCMDNAAREIRLQVSKALPPDGRTTDTDWAAPIQDRLKAKARVRHVLGMVERGL